MDLMSRILSGDPDITWNKILPFFSINNTRTNNYDLATEENKKLIMDIIKSEIKSHPDYDNKRLSRNLPDSLLCLMLCQSRGVWMSEMSARL